MENENPYNFFLNISMRLIHGSQNNAFSRTAFYYIRILIKGFNAA